MIASKGITPHFPQGFILEDTILAAVDRVLARDGYEGLELQEVALQSGLTKSELSLYFQSRQDLILGHADWIARRVLVGARKIVARREKPVVERIRELLLYRVLAHFDATRHFSDSFEAIARDVGPALLARREEFMIREAELLQPMLREGQAAGLLRRDDPRATAFAFLLVTNALLPLSNTSAQNRRTLEETARRLVELMMHGLRAAPPSAQAVGRTRSPKRRGAEIATRDRRC